jgi:hypothetical protein
MCYAFRQYRRPHGKGVLIGRLKLHLHRHVASRCGSDERVSLRDVEMGGKLAHYIILVAKDFGHPFANGLLVTRVPAPTPYFP